jgi:hypothetical protein
MHVSNQSKTCTNNQQNGVLQESSELKQIPVVIMSSENVPTRISR